MLKCIAVVGGDKKAFDALETAAQDRNLQLVRVKRGEKLPPSTSAMIAAGSGRAALDAALAIGGRFEELLNLLAEAIGCRESFAPGSSMRIKEHAMRFAEALGLSADEQSTLERGALVRDIGKLSIPNHVLLKDGVLDYDEWTLLQEHTHIGADLVKAIESLTDTEDIVRRHHECFDGDGYPDKLEGEDIPFLARAVKILDVYCAMTSPRLYRDGHATHEEAIEHLIGERDKHFDPALVDVFVSHDVGLPEAAAPSD